MYRFFHTDFEWKYPVLDPAPKIKYCPDTGLSCELPEEVLLWNQLFDVMIWLFLFS